MCSFFIAGPWFVGEIIDDHIGAAFAWGTYVKGTILPGAFSYFYGCLQVKQTIFNVTNM